MRPILSFVFFTCSLIIQLNAQQKCTEDTLYHYLDFWVGNWKVYENDKYVGSNSIEKILNDCAILEHWTGGSGGQGKSMFYVDNDSRTWRQVWVTDKAKQPWGQKEKEMIFYKKNEEIVFQGQYLVNGQTVLDRTILTRLDHEQVKQLIQYSLDGGQNWKNSFNAVYKRVISYEDKIKEWQDARVKSLQRANGWTTLTGLVWLEEGKQSFGSSPDMDVKFPEALPAKIGHFILKDGKLSCTLNLDSGVTINGEKIDKADLRFDVDGTPSLFNWKSHFWYPIKREDKYGIRLRDTLHPARFALEKIPCFPIDSSWKVTAVVLPPQDSQQVNIENIIGLESSNSVAAILKFEKDGETHQILALDGGPKSFFLIFADETSGEETYGGGRYMYIDRADPGDLIYIDFNKAYNPPCVFTNYATCPLPPKENHLNLAITAGEKMVEILDH